MSDRSFEYQKALQERS